ncbi:zinc-ribbon domain-containing protein [Oceanobacillus profundus]|uniref:zinc-ribbon domain-containing protein n=1 Tax=Oceanobacillus profundus TaxID=372463 RepID=UPI00362A66CD
MSQKSKYENSVQYKHPSIAQEWHPSKNGNLTPEIISKWSTKKVWWMCIKGHEWEAYINNRTKRNDGCPYCSGRYATEETCLLTLNPELASEWHPTKNGDLTPRDITPNSNKKVWWLCSQNPKHEWQAVVGSRFKSKADSKGCPFCSGKRASEEHNLAIANPILASEWQYQKNAPLTPEGVTPSSNKLVWWKCAQCNHEWQSSINNRNGKKINRGCPKCISGYQTSFPEQAIIFYLNDIFPDLVNTYVLPFSKIRMTVDIFIPSLQLAIEYDGEYAHKEKEERDLRKNVLLIDNDIKLIRIREPILPLLDENGIKILYRSDSSSYRSLESIIRDIAEYIFKNFALSDEQERKLDRLSSINIEADSFIIEEQVRMVKEGGSLEHTNPMISKQWHPTLNGNMKPFHYTKNSHKKVWWLCDKAHEYQSRISDKSEECLVCSNKIVQASNCLATTHPKLAKEWHPTKNGDLTPYDVVAGTGKLVWWKCAVCSHEWRTSVAKRRGSIKVAGTGCPACSNKIISNTNCLAVTSPNVAKEWHPTKNGNLTPYDVTSGSDRRAWWLCQTCDHEWDSPIYHRKKTGCPPCGNRKIAKKMFKSNAKFLGEVKDLVGDEYIPQEEYKGSTTYINFLHAPCGNVIRTSPSKFKSAGRRCKCGKKLIIR